MELTILGSGSCVPYARRRSSAYVLKYNDRYFMFDMGSGSTWRLLQNGISHVDIDSIFLTHFHPDHTADFIPFLFATRWSRETPRLHPLNVIAPTGFRDIYDSLMQLYGQWVQTEEYELKIREIPVEQQPGMYTLDHFEIRTCHTKHTDASIAYRINTAEGKSFVYTGDTDYCKPVIELARNVDVLVTECSFPDEMEVDGHLTPSKAGRIAREANVKKLVLSHLYPVCDRVDIHSRCMNEYDGEIIVAEDNMDITW